MLAYVVKAWMPTIATVGSAELVTLHTEQAGSRFKIQRHVELILGLVRLTPFGTR